LFRAPGRPLGPAKAPLLQFHNASAMFRVAVIFVGIACRVRAVGATAENAAQLAPLAERFAVRAIEIVEGGGHKIQD